jgi:iron complex transport system ATP-binding protein
VIIIEGIKHKILEIDKLIITSNTAIIGRNGSGKSLLLRIITHEIYPEKLRKREVFGKRLSLNEARNIFGIVNSELEYFYKNENITVFDAIISSFKEALVVYDFFEFKKDEILRVKKLCESFKLRENQIVNSLSLGEIKKMLIARALIHNPKILCLDEPTNGLDIKAKIEFLETLERLNVIKILITHDFKEITNDYKKIIMLLDGKIFKEGNKDILNLENLSKLFNIDKQKLKAFYG